MKKQIAKIKQHVSQNKETIILTAVSVTAIVVGLAVVTKTQQQIDEDLEVMENPEVVTAFDIFELAAKNLDETIYKVKNANKNAIN